MERPGRVEAYFSRAALGYQDASHGGLWRLVRDREARALLAILGEVRERDILELGCGAGFYTRLLLKAGARHVWAVDFSREMIDRVPKERVTALCADATTVDAGRRFDTLLSAGMLEFVADPAAVLVNAARMSKGGARLALLFPTRSMLGRGYQAFHRRNGLDIHLFDRASLEPIAVRAGWSLDCVASAGPYSGVALLVRGAR